MEAAPWRWSTRPLRRVEYERLVELGVFERERLELVRGRLVPMSPQGPRHIEVVSRLGTALVRQLPLAYQVFQHSPLAVDDISMPEPDVSVTHAKPDGQFPHAPVLVIEVSASSLAYDQDEKLTLYAAGGIPTYWLVDLRHDEVRVHTDPVGDGDEATYRTVRTLRAGDRLRVADLPALELAVTDVLHGAVAP